MSGEKFHYIIPDIPPSNNEFIGRNNRWDYQKIKKQWAQLIAVCCRPKPKFPLLRSAVTLEYHFGDNRRRDPDNYSGKMILDGLKAAGIIEDDSFKCIDLELRAVRDGKRETHIFIESKVMMLANQMNLSISQDHIITYAFDDRNVRFFVDDDGLIWVIARDICDIIGYSNATDFFAGVEPQFKQKIKGKNPQGNNALIAVEISQTIQKLAKSEKHNSKNLAEFILYTGKILLSKQKIKQFHEYTGLSEKLIERVCTISKNIGANVVEKAIDTAISCIEGIYISAGKEREDV